jgi:hypothetical protein
MRLSSSTQPFPEEDQAIFLKVKEVLLQLKKINFSRSRFEQDITVTPYILARAFSLILELNCVHGLFEHYDQLSWLETKNGNIIDIMPIGLFNDSPLLIHKNSSRAKSYVPKTRHEYSAHVVSCVDRIKEAIIKSNNHL